MANVLKIATLAVAVVGLAGSPVWAAQQNTPGKMLVVKDARPGDATKRKILYKVKAKESVEEDVPQGEQVSVTIVGDPITDGATLKIQLDANTDCYDMPANGWSAISTLGFKYKDPKGANGPVKVAAIKRTPSGTFLLKVRIFGKNGPITVVPPNPGIQANTNFSIGNGDEYCSTFDGDTILRNDERFFKAKNAPAPAACNVTACP